MWPGLRGAAGEPVRAKGRKDAELMAAFRHIPGVFAFTHSSRSLGEEEFHLCLAIRKLTSTSTQLVTTVPTFGPSSAWAESHCPPPAPPGGSCGSLVTSLSLLYVPPICDSETVLFLFKREGMAGLSRERYGQISCVTQLCDWVGICIGNSLGIQACIE